MRFSQLEPLRRFLNLTPSSNIFNDFVIENDPRILHTVLFVWDKNQHHSIINLLERCLEIKELTNLVGKMSLNLIVKKVDEARAFRCAILSGRSKEAL